MPRMWRRPWGRGGSSPPMGPWTWRSRRSPHPAEALRLQGAVQPSQATSAKAHHFGVSSAERVVFEHVTKRYPGTGAGNPGAVEDLSFEVPAGKICVLVGPSGCGKTTSLKMVNRLIEPTSGRILIGDTDVAQRDVIELRRGIGYVIQQVGLFPHQTVGENVATVPRLLGWDESRRRA